MKERLVREGERCNTSNKGRVRERGVREREAMRERQRETTRDNKRERGATLVTKEE